MRNRARRWVNLLAIVVPPALALAPGFVARAEAATVLRGTIAHPPSESITVRYAEHERRTVSLDSNGTFSLALEPEPKAPLYVELELGENLGLLVYLRPGETVSLECEGADPYDTAHFKGGAVAENTALAQMSRHYDQADYRSLFARDPAGFEEGVASLEKSLAAALGEIEAARPGLDPTIIKLERARITYFGAVLRAARAGTRGNWSFASALDLDDPSLLGINTYRRFLRDYVKAKALQRAASDPVLEASVNQLTEASYAVAIDTFKSPSVRSALLYDILWNHFGESEDGPFGCKAMDSVMARFERDCTDPLARADIDERYRSCRAGRTAPMIRVYKTVGSTTLDAHIFPAVGAQPGERRPAFLFFHGGGWAAGMPEWGYGQCRHYSELGLVGISFEYRLRWRHGTTPLESVEDAKSAVRWTRTHAAELGVDPERIVVAGFSAGGHLAAAVGTVPGLDVAGEDASVSATPAAMVLMSAPVDAAGDPWFRECLAGRADPTALSPAQHVRSHLPPTIMFHGLHDHLCPFPHTQAFCERMKDLGNRCDLHTFPGGHFRQGAEWKKIDDKTDAFLTSLGLLAPPKNEPTAE
jgi:acetyl esterase